MPIRAGVDAACICALAPGAACGMVMITDCEIRTPVRAQDRDARSGFDLDHRRLHAIRRNFRDAGEILAGRDGLPDRRVAGLDLRRRVRFASERVFRDGEVDGQRDEEKARGGEDDLRPRHDETRRLPLALAGSGKRRRQIIGSRSHHLSSRDVRRGGCATRCGRESKTARFYFSANEAGRRGFSVDRAESAQISVGGASTSPAGAPRLPDQFGTVSLSTGFAASFCTPRRRSKAAISCLSSAGSGGT